MLAIQPIQPAGIVSTGARLLRLLGKLQEMIGMASEVELGLTRLDEPLPSVLLERLQESHRRLSVTSVDGNRQRFVDQPRQQLDNLSGLLTDVGADRLDVSQGESAGEHR